LKTLRDKGIDFKVPEGDLLDWLNDPNFTPYSVISQAPFQLLGSKHLRKPVFLDVIVYKYEEPPGIKVPTQIGRRRFSSTQDGDKMLCDSNKLKPLKRKVKILLTLCGNKFRLVITSRNTFRVFSQWCL
jgi:hypothetical protein